MNAKRLIKDIAELQGINLKNNEVNEIHTKVAHAYLDRLLDEQNPTAQDSKGKEHAK